MEQSVKAVYDYIENTVKAVERYFSADQVREALVTWQSELSALKNCEGVTAVKCLRQLADTVTTLRGLIIDNQGNSNRAKDAIAEGSKITEALYSCQRKVEKPAGLAANSALKKSVEENDSFAVEISFRNMLNAYETALEQSSTEIKSFELSLAERLKQYDVEIAELDADMDKAFDDNDPETAQELENEQRRVYAEKDNAAANGRNNLRVKRNFRKLYDAVIDGATQSFEYVSPEEKLAYMQLLGEPETLRQRMVNADDHTVEAFIILVNDKKQRAYEYSDQIRRKLTNSTRPMVDVDDLPSKKETTLNSYSVEMLERQIKRGKITAEQCYSQLSADKLDALVKRGIIVPQAEKQKVQQQTVTQSGAGVEIRSLTDDILNGDK